MAQTPPKPIVLDELIEDEKSQFVKNKVMSRLRTDAFYNSISKAAMYVGGVVTTAATGAGLGALFHSGIGVLAAFSGPVGIALAIGTAIIGIGIATDYAATRIYQGATFDNLEANADSTARHLVKELKANNMCLTSEHGCQDERQLKTNWTKEYLEKKQAAAAQAVASGRSA